MKYISHRGNTAGPSPEGWENHPELIRLVARTYTVEVDVRMVNGALVLGHDAPTYEVEEGFFYELADELLIHCKNGAAFEFFVKHPGFHFFWHQDDDYCLTSRGIIFVKPGSPIIKGSIAVMPEMANYTQEELALARAICTDRIDMFKGRGLL